MICQAINRSIQDELDFSLKKVKEDFSAFSYSTLYYRSSVFTKGSLENQIDFTQEWQKEYMLILNGLFTSPNDQALWFYLKWLLATNFGKNLNVNIDTGNKESDHELQLIRFVWNRQENILLFHFNAHISELPFERVWLEMANGNRVQLTEPLVPCSSSRRLWFVACETYDNVSKVSLIGGNASPLSDMEMELKQVVDKPISVWISDKLTEIKCDDTNSYQEELKNLLILKELEPGNKCKWFFNQLNFI